MLLHGKADSIEELARQADKHHADMRTCIVAETIIHLERIPDALRVKADHAPFMLEMLSVTQRRRRK
jgi:hypothetical protein